MFGSQFLLPAKGIKIKIQNGTLLRHSTQVFGGKKTL